ncbi:VCBS repeat-containing protein [Arenibacter latericius]|uniref:VCBS repeat-containing protein n=1 Tax=Arenibacter latericius TaxID=86104 RepID=UPI0004142BC4|nr:VCBS repeat-containing protein [Arenibacter latericius]
MKNFTIPIILFAMLVSSCGEEYNLSGLNSEEESIFTKLSMAETGIDFSNDLDEDMRFNGLQYEYYYNGSGLAVADFNNDGLKDLFFVSTLKQHKLFLNRGDLQFEDVSDMTGILYRQKFSGGITIVDINNDGWMDIYISNSGKFNDPEKRKNELYINMGADNKSGIPTFTEQSVKYGLDLSDCSTQAVFFDYDNDGDLDLFLLNHSPTPYPTGVSLAELMTMDGGVANDRLLRNDNNFFTDVSKEAGIAQNRLEYGLGVAVGDVNNDGWPDIYISNDYSGKDHLYINNGDGTFSDRIHDAMNHISFFAMGNDIADINNDGWLDIMTVDMMGDNSYDQKTSMSGMNPKSFHESVDIGLHHQYMYNTLQLNSGFLEDNVPVFSDIAQLTGTSSTDWSWGPLFFDMDNDGHKDLFVSNGIKRDFRNNDFVNYVNKKQDSIFKAKSFDPKKYITDVLDKMPSRKKENYFYRNRGNLDFVNMNRAWGDGSVTSSNGAVYADLDNDGDLEIIVNNSDDKAYILKNNSRELGLGRYIAFKLNGPSSNIDGIGTRVIVTTEEGSQVQELYFTRGFMSAMGRQLHFGLGAAKEVKVEVIWPDNKRQLIKNVKADQLLTLNYSDAKKVPSSTDLPLNIFELSEITGIDYHHVENDFDDFERESLLPHKMSDEGPAIAVGDINGDGLDDIHIGGALGSPGIIYIQQKDGSFIETNKELMMKDSVYEDVASLFIDVDGDNDLDLYVVSGGNENDEGSPLLLDRIYINNGSGQFQYDPNALPKIAISGSIVKAVDYDNDGDLDLFIGGRQVPGEYPKAPKSYLLQNNSENGKVVFSEVKDVFGEVNPNLGMVTDALWVDLNKDGNMDLVVTGEWMPIRVFENDGKGAFIEKTEEYGFNETNGWWYSLAAYDFDNDGDLDIVAGNLGLNYKYKAEKDAPFEVYGSDFDESGTNDIVLGFYDDEKLVPVRGRQCSSEQMPFIKKKFPTYDSFGKATIDDIFDENQLENSTHLKAYTFATSYFENKGGHFEIRKLDNLAQLSSVNQILVDDFNGNGHKDLVMVGNLYGSEVETPRNDASYGMYLEGDGKGNFKAIPTWESGLMVKGDVKNARTIMVNGKRHIILAKNDDRVEVVGVKSLARN